nr:DNA-binding protein [uncultured Bacteroides sp.]
MNRTITFNELRKIKDSLPSGSMHRIADELNLDVDTVRNFFGGSNFKEGKSVGLHTEPGPDGGLVMLDDTTVLDFALKILDEHNINHREEVSEELMQV